MKTAYSYDLDLGPKRGCKKITIMGNINERNCSFGAKILKAYASFSVYYEFSVNICKSPFAESLTCLTLISPQTFLSLRLGGVCVSLLPFCSAFPLTRWTLNACSWLVDDDLVAFLISKVCAMNMN